MAIEKMNIGLRKVVQIVSLVALTVLASSCLEKANNLSTESKEVTNKLWQWDDLQKSWLYDGSVYSAKANIPSSVWKRQANAILLRVESPKSLTMFDNAPNALQMKLFQLSDSKAFLQAAKSSSGLKHLLVTDQIDPAILGIERLIVLPGVGQSLSLERLEGVRYIGIILGYASLDQEKSFRLIPIVTVDDSNPPKASSATVPGHPATLKINLALEANGINKIEVDVR